jgi:hypothetical protein
MHSFKLRKCRFKYCYYNPRLLGQALKVDAAAYIETDK